MRLNVVLKLLIAVMVYNISLSALAKEEIVAEAPTEEPAEDPKKDAWLDTCMKDSGWYNEDGMVFCACLAGEACSSKGSKRYLRHLTPYYLLL